MRGREHSQKGGGEDWIKSVELRHEMRNADGVLHNFFSVDDSIWDGGDQRSEMSGPSVPSTPSRVSFSISGENPDHGQYLPDSDSQALA